MMTDSRMTNLGWLPLTNFSNHRIISVEYDEVDLSYKITSFALSGVGKMVAL